MSSSTPNKHLKLEINIGDQLTTISCGHVVAELIKFIAYQRLQIPYTYPWLKQLITKRKELDHENRKESFQSEKHFRTAETALKNLDLILKSLLLEINSPSMPDEVCIILGATPITCKEVYRLILPATCHRPQCHSSLIASDQKIHRNVFRAVVTSEKLNEMFLNTLAPTNMFVFLKKRTFNDQDALLDTSNYSFTSGHRIPASSRIIVINFRTGNTENFSCCNEFKIFSDVSTTDIGIEDSFNENCEELNEIESTDTIKWYQSSYVMKGFKDCIVNGSSITNTWMSS
ncbi:uncharacterized protein LOC101742634 isoform X1 [Bombyx mori]|uniref:MAD2L1-binding protein n=1 Tax=Bombyx mori TaxID=7091 RepID=A0A8R2M831_BOMMO|nr:uncharacterized protein LOC101742634 isoform X1 [Bombyx mori]